MANVLLGIHCVVPGCTSTLRKVNQWKARPCPKPKHKGKTQSQCMCPEPYQFFKFPTEIKLLKLWLDRVKRPDLEINNLTRVCSLHFIEGKPTRKNYFPNINLHTFEEDADNEEDVEEEQKKEAKPTPAKIPRRGGASSEPVSIVPMDRLQEADVYEGDLTISRFSYHKRVEETPVTSRVYENVQTPTNTVTITRVTTSAKPSTVNAPAGARPQIDKRKITSITSPRVIQRGQQSSSSGKIKRFVEVPEENEEQSYDMHIVEEGNESEVVESTPTVVSYHSQAEPRQIYRQVQVPAQPVEPPTRSVLVRPKLIPVLAVAPKSQHQIPQLIAKVEQSSQGPSKLTPAPPAKLVQFTPTPAPANSTATANSTGSTVAAAEATPSPDKPLATYDPSKQQLQIANPVKYIQECHQRIAELAAENDKLKTKNTQLETEVQDLQRTTSELKREITSLKSMNTVKRVPVPTSRINILPNQSVNDNNHTTTASTAPKTRIRYVIRRPIQ